MTDSAEVCGICGKPGVKGQPFSGGLEYYCPHCDEIYSYPERAPVDCVLSELTRSGATGAVVAQEGNLDDLVTNLVSEGWTPGETVHVGGKRIRYMHPPQSSAHDPEDTPEGPHIQEKR